MNPIIQEIERRKYIADEVEFDAGVRGTELAALKVAVEELSKIGNKFPRDDKLASISDNSDEYFGAARAKAHRDLADAALTKIAKLLGVGGDQVTTEPEKNKCERCGAKVPEGLHSCPFAEEIYGDDTPCCNCCDGCAHQCAMDI